MRPGKVRAAVKRDDPKCHRCGHKKSRHGPDCSARYSCGPSGTFRCMCEGFTHTARVQAHEQGEHCGASGCYCYTPDGISALAEAKARLGR